MNNHSGNVSSSSTVNGDIAIQREWSNFDPSQNPNPLTIDKTLHNWLRPGDEHVTQNLCESAVRERLAKYVKYKASLFLFFSPDSLTEVTRAWNFTHDGSQHALWRKEVPFGVHTMADNILRFKFPNNRKPSKMALYKHVRVSANGLKSNDVIEDWRHLLAVARRTSSVYYL